MDSPAHRPARQSAPTRPEPAGTPDHAHHEHDKAPPAHRTGGAQQATGYRSDSLARAARLTPGYWADRAISGAYEATSMSAAVIGRLLVDCGICALFAVAVFSVAVAVGRARARSVL